MKKRAVKQIIPFLCTLAILANVLFLLVGELGSITVSAKAGTDAIRLQNPILRDANGVIYDQGNNDGGYWYADAEIHYFEGKYWIYPTRSHDYELQLNFDCFSSEDLVTWEKHESIIDMRGFTDVWRSVWAPTVIEKDGWYYILFGTNDKGSNGNVGGMFIARSQSPDGPFEEFMGRNVPLVDSIINGAQAIDAQMFKDDDGTVYLYYGGWGHCNMSVFSDDMTKLLPIGENGSLYIEITNQLPNFVEGVNMMKRENEDHELEYYLIYSVGGWTVDTYGLEYARADSPLGPFEHVEGRILQMSYPIAKGPGHHGVVKVPDREDMWLLAYHRRPVDETASAYRQTNIDILEFNPDGTIRPIIMTDEWDEENPLNPNLAMIFGASYSASGYSRNDRTSKFAFDVGISDASMWEVVKNVPGHWLAVDFGSPQTFDNFELHFRSVYNGKFRLQTSDNGEEWTDITESRSFTSAERQASYGTYFVQEKLEAPVTAKHLRVYFDDAPGEDRAIAIGEFEVYLGDSGPINGSAKKAKLASADVSSVQEVEGRPEIIIPSDGELVFYDDFSAEEFDFESWRIREPVANHLWEHDTDKNKLVVTGRGGDDYGSGSVPGQSGWQQYNLFLTSADVNRNFDIYTEFTVDPLPYTNYMQSGLYVHFDHDNYMRMGRVYDNGRTIETAIELGGSYSKVTYKNTDKYPSADINKMNFKIEKRDMYFQAFYWDETEWIAISEPSNRLESYNKLWDGLEVGVYSTGANNETNLLETSFDYFAVVDVGEAVLPDEPLPLPEPGERDVQPGEDPNDGLRIHYTFDKTLDNQSSSGSYYNAEPHGNLELVHDGVFGEAIKLNGNSGRNSAYLDLNKNILNGMDSMTVSLWVQPGTVQTWARIWDFGSDTNKYIFLCPRDSNGNLLFRAESNTDVALSSGILPTNQWSHVVTTIELQENGFVTSGKIYVNGELVAVNNNFRSLDRYQNTINNFIGRSQYSDPGYNGTIDDFRLYSRALSDSEVKNLANEGLTVLRDRVISNIEQNGLDFGIDNLDYVDKNLTMPTASALCPANSNMSISWTSSDSAVINSQTGVVIRPGKGQEAKQVTLTARIYKNTVEGFVRFNLIVPPIEEELAIDPISPVTVPIGVQPSLPSTHTANNGRYNINLVWDTGEQWIYSQPGTKALSGTILENGEKISVDIIVVSDTFKNPVVPAATMRGSSDPYVLQKDGYYYYVRVDNETSVSVAKTSRLEDIGQAGRKTVWTPGKDTEYGYDLRSPSMYEMDGKWYIYVSANDGLHQKDIGRTDSKEGNFAIYVLESDSPMGPFEMKGKLTANGEWAVDGVILHTEEQNYFVWSGKDGSRNQNLYIAEMPNPYTIGERHLLSEPTNSWERYDSGVNNDDDYKNVAVNEGPAVLIRDNDVYVVYSANISRSPNSGLGMLKTTLDKPLLNKDSWQKSDGLVMKSAANSNTRAYMLRQACFVKSPDGTEDWILYQANYTNSDTYTSSNKYRLSDSRYNYYRHRSIRMQKFDWTEDAEMGTVPHFGSPAAFNSYSALPSGTSEAPVYKFEGEYAAGRNTGNTSYNNASNGVTKYIYHDGFLTFLLKDMEAGTYYLTLMGSANEYGAEQVVSVNDSKYFVAYPFYTYNNQFAPTRLIVKLQQGDNTIVVENAKLRLGELNGYLSNEKYLGGDNYSQGAHVDYIVLEPVAETIDPPAEVNKKLLKAAIDYANAQDISKLIAPVKVKFEAALSHAEAVYDSTDATQEEVDQAAEQLLDMIHMLSFTGDPTELEQLVALADTFYEELDKYKDGPVKEEFIAALGHAKEVLAEETSLDADFEEAYNRLSSALEALKDELKPVTDTNELEKMIRRAEEIKNDRDKYLDTRWDDFLAALEEAKTVLDNSEEQDEIDTATMALYETILNLRLKPNKDLLQSLLQQAGRLDMSLCAASTVDAVEKAREEGQRIYDDSQATQKQVTEATRNLADALKGAEAFDSTALTNTGKQADSDAKATSGMKNPKTGETSATPYGIGLLAGFAVVFLTLSKKTLKKKQ